VGRYSFADVQRALFPEPPRRKTLAELKAGIGREMKRRHAKR
jgi:hypothetical protein